LHQRHLWKKGSGLWSVLASRNAGDPHIELIVCVDAHPHTDWLDFRITILGAALKVDQEGLPSFQEVSDLAIARLVGITVSRDVDAVGAFRASAVSILVILPGNGTPVAMEGGWYAIGCQRWRCCGSNDKRMQKTSHGQFLRASLERRGCSWRVAASDFGLSGRQ
jgi:hypothetical protein